MTTPKSTPLICSGHTRPVPQLAFSDIDREGQYLLISSCKDGKAMLRDGILGDWLGTFLGHKGAVWCSKLSSDGALAITGSADFTAKIWETFSGTEISTLPHEHIVKAVDLSKDGKWAVTGTQDKKLRLFELNNPDQPILFGPAGVAHSSPIRALILDMSRNLLLSVDDSELKWWNTNNPAEPVQTQTFKEGITNLGRSTEDLLTLCAGKSMHVIDLNEQKITSTLSLAFKPSSASIHPLQKDRFVTGSTEDGWVRIHSMQDGAEQELLKGHHGPVHCISYSPDAELFASGSEDGTIRLWQVSAKDFGLWRLQDNSNNGAA